MREILFRGKDTSGNWIEGDLLQYLGAGKVHIAQNYTGAGGREVASETVGQYTGLTDKNGQKVFEGDIVNVITNKNELWHTHKGRHLVIKYDEYHRFVASGNLEYPLCSHYEWEVNGNIHDNPELLKGE